MRARRRRSARFGPALSPARAGWIWLQNHGGVYRSDDGGDSWLSVGEGIPDDFGFGIVTHPRNADCAYVVPLVSSGAMPHWAPDNRLRVYRTTDGGANGEPLDSGLPESVYCGVLRDAFSSGGERALGLYFGTTSGRLNASMDEGGHWTLKAEHLPRMLSVVAAAL